MSNTDCEELFGDPPAKKYRYFNQPIEQIPGWKTEDYQFLVHSPNCGLQWISIECTKCDESGETAAIGSLNNYSFDDANKKWISSDVNSSCLDPTTELES